MTADSPRHPVARGLVLGSAAILALALACSAPAPTDSPAGTEEADPAPPATITGRTVPAPPQGRAGDTDSGQIRSGSDGDGNTDASNGDPARTPEAVPTPAPEPPASGSPQESDGETARDLRELASEPTFTPYTVAPDLSNPIEVVQALREEYPPLLRDAGIGGSILVWFLIDEEGRLRTTLIRESSGQAALDQAALRVAERMRFTPARNGDETVPVWISLPITFRVN